MVLTVSSSQTAGSLDVATHGSTSRSHTVRSDVGKQWGRECPGCSRKAHRCSVLMGTHVGPVEGGFHEPSGQDTLPHADPPHHSLISAGSPCLGCDCHPLAQCHGGLLKMLLSGFSSVWRGVTSPHGLPWKGRCGMR